MSPEHAADLVCLRLAKPESYAFLKWAENWEETNRGSFADIPQEYTQSQLRALYFTGWHNTHDLKEEMLVLCFAAWVHADGADTD